MFEAIKKILGLGSRVDSKAPPSESAISGAPREKQTPRFSIVSTRPVVVDSEVADTLRKTFIALDLETTGLSPAQDRIVEIGAVLFVDGAPVNTFSSLIDPNIDMPKAASDVNHITNSMLRAAPQEDDIYPQFADFLGEALSGQIIMCAHNAKFDFDFLCNTFSRLGINASIRYVDTLSLSRKCLDGLANYKQGTIEAYLGLTNASAHRAASDAENCGKILCALLKRVDAILERERASAAWGNWYSVALPYWTQGETARKNGQFEEAIRLYDQAKNCEVVPPYLFESYAMIYRKNKDYESEIRILEEGIARTRSQRNEQLYMRKQRATELLAARANAEKIADEKARRKEERIARKLREAELAAARPKQPSGRPIVQMDDSGAIIREYESVASAAREIGVGAKSIRSAAKGEQRHAGGYCWRYKDTGEPEGTAEGEPSWH